MQKIIDVQTGDESVADSSDLALAPEVTTDDLRQIAVMSREDFAVASAQAGWISEAEAEEWAAGAAIPSFVADVINSVVPQEERLSTRIRIRTQPDIARNGSLIPALKAELNITDAELDALFGLT